MFAKLLFALTLASAMPAPLALAGPKADTPEKECPHALSEFDKINEDLDKAATCSAALELFAACAAGGSSDVGIGGAALKRCERDFLARLTPAQKRRYDAEHRRCDRKYSRREGTMYRSAESFCLVEVAEKYSKLFAKAGGPARR